MASLLRDAIFRLAPAQQPRIVGLTASFVNGSMKDIIKKREKLEVLMQANLISPDVDAETTSNRQFIRIIVPYEDVSSLESLVSRFVATIFRTVLKNVILQFEVEKWTMRSKIVFAGTGGEGLLFWLKEGILLQLSNEAEELLLRSESACLSKGRTMKIGVEAAKRALKMDNNGSFINNFPRFTKKAQSLLDLLWQLYSNAGKESTFRGLVFVEQVALTYPICFIVNTFFAEQISVFKIPKYDDSSQWPMLPVSGAGSMLDRTREEHLTRFRSGAVPLLVSTSALEEGIDVADCSFVIRFDTVKTTKAHIQGSGRARSGTARIYYFEDDPIDLCAHAAQLDIVAKDTRLNLSKSELQDRMKESNTSNSSKLPQAERVVHPFVLGSSPMGSVAVVEDDRGQVNFFNCLQILYEYTQVVMKQSFDPEACLYEIRRGTAPTDVKVVEAVRYPSPQGMITIRKEQIDAFWKGLSVEDVVTPAERLRNMKTWDFEKRRAVCNRSGDASHGWLTNV